ncbi:MAG: GAF domain-containing protein [Burkholderiales bacterium]
MEFTARQTAERFKRFSSILSASGLREALADLLGPTDYRFIAIFRFDGDWANAAVFYDRANPDVRTLDAVPARATYCNFARKSRVPYITDNAPLDDRLVDHVARQQVQAYCGVPILTPEGEFLGTLCHYDVVPRDASQLDLALLCEVCSALEQSNLVPPYPAASTGRNGLS